MYVTNCLRGASYWKLAASQKSVNFFRTTINLITYTVQCKCAHKGALRVIEATYHSEWKYIYISIHVQTINLPVSICCFSLPLLLDLARTKCVPTYYFFTRFWSLQVRPNNFYEGTFWHFIKSVINHLWQSIKQKIREKLFF